jgi:hypothetical protein
LKNILWGRNGGGGHRQLKDFIPFVNTTFHRESVVVQGCQIFLGVINQNEKISPNDSKLYEVAICAIYQITAKYTEWRELCTYTNISNSKAVQNAPKSGFLVCKKYHLATLLWLPTGNAMPTATCVLPDFTFLQQLFQNQFSLCNRRCAIRHVEIKSSAYKVCE